MWPLNLKYLHCLQNYFFEHLFNLYWYITHLLYFAQWISFIFLFQYVDKLHNNDYVRNKNILFVSMVLL